MIITKSRVVYDRYELTCADDLLEHVSEVRRYDDELDLYYDSGKPGILTRLATIKLKDVGEVQSIDALEHFKDNYERYWEILNG